MHTTRTLVLLATLVLAACQSSDAARGSESSTSEAATTTEASTAPTSLSATTAALDETTATTDDGANPFGGDDPEDRLMPSVVCMNLQDAQNEIQDHGVFASRSEDATGQDRNQINDSNWQVVAQQPEPGTAIGERDAVLSVVKYGEQPNPC